MTCYLYRWRGWWVEFWPRSWAFGFMVNRYGARINVGPLEMGVLIFKP